METNCYICNTKKLDMEAKSVRRQLVDGGVDGLQQGGAGVALAQRDGNVGSILGLGHDLEICVRMNVQVVVEGDISVQGGVNAAGSLPPKIVFGAYRSAASVMP